MKFTFEFIISMLFMTIGLIGTVVFLKRKDALMLGASQFLLFGSLFFEMIIMTRRVRHLEGKYENRS